MWAVSLAWMRTHLVVFFGLASQTVEDGGSVVVVCHAYGACLRISIDEA